MALVELQTKAEEEARLAVHRAWVGSPIQVEVNPIAQVRHQGHSWAEEVASRRRRGQVAVVANGLALATLEENDDHLALMALVAMVELLVVAATSEAR